ncbi:MAG: NUDIX hydrolase [Sulfitobacter sp.]|jgi:8-oxo-dGTP pyrophosphatase MutT (NUDIX family)|uniref:NUDIX hydrolase n=1 Tax=Sulfitobacter sp. TaxID=1903071 RepID=UPI000C0FE0A9|nr:NUDIX hydrolase [Roseobacter sp.]MBV48788.1 NUDIX hydrolase [Roseobacter sp.]PHR00535.1 MAG: NUDIX hydrolase [Sulfitobacter sp.]|tara:strand:- start:1274 stop:1732 length:459 start_codon:yes stop_codon:yes gene_type:complete
MIHNLKRAWEDVILPIWQRPKRVQIAALCYRETPHGKEVLLITSRDTGRWIVPKGWPIDGLDGAGTALQEAWEEAGVSKADIEAEPIGFYDYDKRLSEGMTTPVIAQVYLTRVRHIKDDYPEVALRKRRWMTPTAAAELVSEPDLKEILLNL